MSERRRRAYRKGLHAEFAAAVLLKLKGYRILARRYRSPVGEIDLVAQRGRRYAFVEIKMRPSQAESAFAVSTQQQHRIARAAEHWLSRNQPDGDFDAGFDVILLSPWSWPRHLADAFRI
jgi:putative endonuclease